MSYNLKEVKSLARIKFKTTRFVPNTKSKITYTKNSSTICYSIVHYTPLDDVMY